MRPAVHHNHFAGVKRQKTATEKETARNKFNTPKYQNRLRPFEALAGIQLQSCSSAKIRINSD